MLVGCLSCMQLALVWSPGSQVVSWACQEYNLIIEPRLTPACHWICVSPPSIKGAGIYALHTKAQFILSSISPSRIIKYDVCCLQAYGVQTVLYYQVLATEPFSSESQVLYCQAWHLDTWVLLAREKNKTKPKLNQTKTKTWLHHVSFLL